MFFFFQAEDGIRDDLVTGVQTCALPISTSPRAERALDRRKGADLGIPRDAVRVAPLHLEQLVLLHPDDQGARSEERRVGKECRSGWARDHEKEKEGGSRTVVNSAEYAER